ncbi:ATP-dependent helicase [Streptacidiphilus sp. ASG 303]|uniref:UvrD-helicase domain-containing protein n=1 Tax=Streptacidiphilus sp. ASG 303 TaxID=2896847 RepID=UPI001E631F44|nr:ATP-dependent helicase [Streptacidiphilus sp. ASG 303]MCD0483437.1 ATP-dependent helicase [Streptacidiphilus sp. ASG 303]
MSDQKTVRPVLAAEIEQLNPAQRMAAMHNGDLVVRAGPGSGKTRTLVARVGYLLESEISRYRGVAALTYTRHAAQEIVDRLDRLSVRPGRRLTAGTVHSWCLSAVLRPYSYLVGLPSPDESKLVDDKSGEWITLLQRCFDVAGALENPRYEKAAITRLRRRIAAGYEVQADDPMTQAAILVDRELERRGWIDFDAMVSRSLKIINENPKIARLIVSRYPSLVVDEYQDLGPVLHRLVVTLRDEFDIQVSAFGDVDQAVMGFTGAEPEFLNELSSKDKFETISLPLNYRSGQAIISASQAVLNESRPYQATPDREDLGSIELAYVEDGGLWDHSNAVMEYIDEFLASGFPCHQIAVLYPRKGPLLDALLYAFKQSSHAYVHEGDESLPRSDLTDFIRTCAARTFSGFQPIGSLAEKDASDVATLRGISRRYAELRRKSGLVELESRACDALIAEVCVAASWGSSGDLLSWLSFMVETLELKAVANASNRIGDSEDLKLFLDRCEELEITFEDMSSAAIRAGKVTLTTYHSAKGREWDVVILPGLVEGVMPGWRWNQRMKRFVEPSGRQLSQDRMAFYVGLTRARSSAVLVFGDYWEGKYGYVNRFGISRFARDVIDHMSAQ